MRSFLKLLIILSCFLALARCAAIEQPKQEKSPAETLLEVDSGVEHSNEGKRLARQFYGYYGRPAYGGYYGNYGRPYYGAYGFSRPYYGGYGGLYRPYYGSYFGFYG